MTLFEYISVAISLILSLGIVRILEGSLSALSPSRLYPIHAGWVVVKFFNHFMYWWVQWGLRGAEWNFPRFLYLSLPPVILYLQATLLVSSTPRLVDSWRDHYYSIAPVFFGLNAMFALGMMSQLWVIDDAEPAGLLLLISCLAILASLVCAVTRQPLVHGVLLALIVGINLLSIFSIAFLPVQD